jgi:histone H3/H4
MARVKNNPQKTDEHGNPPWPVQKKKRLPKKPQKRKSLPRKSVVSRAERAVPGSIAIREIKRYQASTDLLIPRKPFSIAVNGIYASMVAEGTASPGYKFGSEAMEATQCACEDYLVDLFQDSLLCTLHRSRITLATKDMQLARKIRRED